MQRSVKRALAIDERAHGAEDPTTAISLNNLARLLRDQGDLTAARPLYERALAIREQTLGPKHPTTAASLNNLAGLLFNVGDYTTAQPLFERALAIAEQALGSEHPNTAFALNNLATLLTDQGDYAAAQPLFERALAIRKKALGPEHPSTIRTLNNLAGLLRNQGDYAGAWPLYERLLRLQQHIDDYAGEATSFFNLGQMAAAQGQTEAGARLMALCSRIERLIEHPDIGNDESELATIIDKLGYGPEQVKALQQQVAAAYEVDRWWGLVRAAAGAPMRPSDEPPSSQA